MKQVVFKHWFSDEIKNHYSDNDYLKVLLEQQFIKEAAPHIIENSIVTEESESPRGYQQNDPYYHGTKYEYTFYLIEPHKVIDLYKLGNRIKDLPDPYKEDLLELVSKVLSNN